MISRRCFLLSLGALASLSLAGCTDPLEEHLQSISPFGDLTPVSLVEIDRLTQGFEVGSASSVYKTFVFFDSQCPHCARLWSMMPELEGYARFKWIPVGILNTSSKAQGHTLLAAADPRALMDKHESMILSGSRGITPASDFDVKTRAALEQNNRVLTSLGASSVPYVVGPHKTNGKVVTNAGAPPKDRLIALMGWA